ncbi:MAG: FAD binding domain-containing protein [Burkholderiales bacterium]
MKPPIFAYVAPDTIEECTALLREYGSDAKIIAGGQSLMPMLNLRMIRPKVLIDISRIKGLDRIDRVDGKLRIGAMVRQRASERAPLVAQFAPLLAEAVPHIGHVATRSRGTVVGSLCHADPAAELPVCAMLLGAELILQSQAGSRTANAAAFFSNAMVTTVRDDELVAAVQFPAPGPGTGFAFCEMARRAGDFALVSVAATIHRDRSGNLVDGAVALGGVGDVPKHFRLGEFAAGARIDAKAYEAFGAHVASAVEARSDLHASAEYRRSVAAALVPRALDAAATHAASRR